MQVGKAFLKRRVAIFYAARHPQLPFLFRIYWMPSAFVSARFLMKTKPIAKVKKNATLKIETCITPDGYGAIQPYLKIGLEIYPVRREIGMKTTPIILSHLLRNCSFFP